jgi:hypothetical protein
MAALPSPVQSKSLSVPSDHSLRFDDRESGSPAAPKTREPDPKKSIGAPPTQPMVTIATLKNQELMPQGQNLNLQCYAGSKSLTNRRKEQEHGRQHGLSKLSWRRFKFNWFNENRVFGRDTHAPTPKANLDRVQTLQAVAKAESCHFRRG